MRGRKNAIVNGQDNINPLYNEAIAREREHERQREEHMKKLRAQHLQNIGGDKPKMNDQQLLKKEQQDKAFATKLNESQQQVDQVENDIVQEMDQEPQQKNVKKVEKKTPSLDL